MVARLKSNMIDPWWQNDNGDKVVGGKTGKGALLLTCRSVGKTSHPMLHLSNQQ